MQFFILVTKFKVYTEKFYFYVVLTQWYPLPTGLSSRAKVL